MMKQVKLLRYLIKDNFNNLNFINFENYSKKNILNFPLALLLIYVGNLLIGFGSFISMFWI